MAPWVWALLGEQVILGNDPDQHALFAYEVHDRECADGMLAQRSPSR